MGTYISSTYTSAYTSSTLGITLTRKKEKIGGKGEVRWKINRVQHLDFWSLKRRFRTPSQWGFVLSFISCKFSSPLRRTIYRAIYILTLPKLMVALLLSPILSTPKTSSYLVHTWPNKNPFPETPSRNQERDSAPPTHKLDDHDVWGRKAEEICLQTKKGRPKERWIDSPDGSNLWL